MQEWPGIVEYYRQYLPLKEKTEAITLLEGNTPLIEARTLGEELGIRLMIKYEGTNPTCSFKDRGMAMALTRALEEEARAIICASTGNTSASAAAYGARAGLDVYVVIPQGKIALGKLSQAMIHGARVIAVEGNFDQALQLVREIVDQHPIQLVNSINPYRIEGQKTASFEICDRLSTAPDYLALPVGNAGNITAYWRGFKEYHARNIIPSCPVMLGFEAEGAAPIVEKRPIEKPETLATAIQIGNPARWQEASAAADESGGLIDKVSDDQIIDAYRQLSAREGIFCEPASAASVAGVIMSVKRGVIKRGSTVVAVATGHGLKDPQQAISQLERPVPVEASLSAVEREIFDQE